MTHPTSFEAELKKVFGSDLVLANTKYVGRSCLGSLSSDLKVKAEFVTSEYADQYDTLKVSVINRAEGLIDKVNISLQEVWGLKKIPGNLYLQDGVKPYLWHNSNKLSWYAYQPTAQDMSALRETVKDYVEVFQTQAMDQTGIHMN